MSTEITVALIVAVGGALTILGNYMISRRQATTEERKTSGDISTSDAASLWAESNALRAEYKKQAEENRERAEKLEAQLKEVNKQLQDVMTQLTRLKGRGDIMQKEIDDLKRVIAKLRKENTRLLAERKKVDL